MIHRKSILFVVDIPNWAYEFMVTTWLPYLKEYDCYIAYAKDYHIKHGDFSISDKIKNQLLNIYNPKDLRFRIKNHYAYPIYKNPPVFSLPEKKAITNKLHFDYIIEMAYFIQMTAVLPFTADKKFVGIFTDGYPHEGPAKDFVRNLDYRNFEREKFFNEYLSRYNGMIVGCNNLVRAYTPYTENIQFVYGIYKQEEFGKEKIPHKDFTIGWTGNPNREMKGFNEIIIPAIEEVRKTGRIINLKTKHSGPYEELFDFYKDVDLVTIASRADSGPSLFAEASLSNIPCISTAVGLPEMVIQDGINGMIVNRNIEDFKNAIIKLYDDRSLLESFSNRIKDDYLKVMDNKLTVQHFKIFIKTH